MPRMMSQVPTGWPANSYPLQYEFAQPHGPNEPVDNVSKMGRGRQVEVDLAYVAYQYGELIPSKGGESETYIRRFVFETVKGCIRTWRQLDFSAM